jgi:hypothetical protein
MKRILAAGLVAISIAFISACGPKADTTAQLFNNTLFGGRGWTASLSLAGATLTSDTSSWGTKTKLNNCDTQTATLSAPDGSHTFSGTSITCEKHNLYTLDFNGRSLALTSTTGSVK